MTVVSFEPEVSLGALPTPRDLYQEIPLTEELATFILRSRKTLEAILCGRDRRRLLIVGPCSIHDPDSALEYASRLKALSDEVSDEFFLIMRTYFEKPRTLMGWKGLLYDPDLDGSYDIEKGLRITRHLLVEISKMGVPTGCELLEINTSQYYDHFLTWGCIGARTSASPPHRQLASSLNLPIGFKNSTDGNLDHSIHGILSAKLPHVFLGMDRNGQMIRMRSEGNPFCHIVLRGSMQKPNYGADDITHTVQKCISAKILDKIVVDCSHDNSQKEPARQMSIFESLITQILNGNKHILGIMLESHLERGAQLIRPNLRYGVSITDPCLDWESTARLILNAHAKLHNSG